VKRAKVIFALFITAALTACVNLQESTPTSTARITPAPVLPTQPATLPPTPQVAVIEDVNLKPGASQGDWIVVGSLSNDSAMKLSALEIKVSLFSDDDALIAHQVISAALQHLASGESSPFIARFTELDLPARAEAEIVSYQTSIFTRGELEINDLTSTPTEDGGLAIFGRLTNQSTMSLAIHRLGLTTVGPETGLLDITASNVHLTTLEPAETSHFLAVMASDPGNADLIPYYDATATVHPTYPVLTLSQEPSLKFTAQGNPFVVGEIHNPDDQPRWATFLVELMLDDETFGLASITPPTPLGPGENRAFTVASFPGLRSKLAGQATQPDDIRVEITYDPRASSPSDATFFPLDLNINLYETIGSSLIVRGKVSNTGPEAVQSAIVQAAVRLTSGEPLTAGWLVAADALGVGESVEFILPLTLPQGADPAMSEYDFQAAGLAP
jgi:hypothetical protein